MCARLDVARRVAQDFAVLFTQDSTSLPSRFEEQSLASVRRKPAYLVPALQHMVVRST